MAFISQVLHVVLAPFPARHAKHTMVETVSIATTAILALEDPDTAIVVL